VWSRKGTTLEDRRNRGVGGFTLLTFVILLFAMFWLTNTLGERADMLSRKEFEELMFLPDGWRLN